MREMMVRAAHAFDAPDVLTMFVGEMRQQVREVGTGRCEDAKRVFPLTSLGQLASCRAQYFT